MELERERRTPWVPTMSLLILLVILALDPDHQRLLRELVDNIQRAVNPPVIGSILAEVRPYCAALAVTA